MMNRGVLLFLLVAGVIAAVAFLVRLKRGVASNKEGAPPSFKTKALLTANELEFLSRLETAAPELRFHAQVSMAALIEPAASRKNGKDYFRARGMFAQKFVDFVAQSRPDGTIVAVIELDDRTHDPERDSKRDVMLRSAGYKVVRWASKAKPDAAAIRAELLARK